MQNIFEPTETSKKYEKKKEAIEEYYTCLNVVVGLESLMHFRAKVDIDLQTAKNNLKLRKKQAINSSHLTKYRRNI